MATPVVTLVVSSASVRSFGARPPTVDETVERVVRAVQLGAMKLAQPVRICDADDVLVGLYHAAHSSGAEMLVVLPSGEVVDLHNAVLRPASPISGFIRDAAL